MEEQLLAPPPRRYSMKPALLVGAIAVVILVIFSLGAAFTHTAPTQPKGANVARTVKGSTLKALGATAALSVIEQDGQPPNNVLNAITLPSGAVRTGSSNPGAGSSFDKEVLFSVKASQGAVLGFYRTELHDLGWRVITSGAATRQSGEQIVGQIAGEDGFYWQMGIIVAPSTFGSSETTDTTGFTLRILQVGDEGS